MISAELPSDEDLRLKDLNSYDILDTLPESDFDELAELAAYICKCPVSLISFVSKERQWFKAKKGTDTTQTSRDIAFCAHAILHEEIMIVEDATKDIRFNDNPLVIGDLDLRFYAGAPIISPAGYKIGSICVIDHVPRKLTAEEESTLFILSKHITKLLELRKKNMIIWQRAEEIISIKSRAMSNFMQKNQEDKKAIAMNLHEVLAQEIASSMLYLNVAEENETSRIPMIQAAWKQLHGSLDNIRKLSKSITSLTTDLLSIEDLVREYIEMVADTFPFKIRINSISKKNNDRSEKTTVIIQIIKKWLKKLADSKKTSLLSITLHSDKQFELLMKDDAPVQNLAELEDWVSTCLLSEIAASEGGKVEFSISEKKENIVKVTLPFGTVKDNDL